MPAGPAPTIENVVNTRSGRGDGAGGSEARGDGVDAITALIDGILDEREAAEFADDEHILHGGFVLGSESGKAGADAGLARTMVMAPTGQASAQRLWPMHL